MRQNMFLISLTTGVVAASVALGDPILPQFDARSFSAPDRITHPYFATAPGVTNVLNAFEDGQVTERSELSVAGPGRIILGVQTLAILDRAFEGDRLVEMTRDYFAQDDDGNVWYMGEDVTNYHYDDAGVLIGTDDASAWIAGVDEARPGYIMPAAPEVGLAYFQEHAPLRDAMDEAEVFAIGRSVDGRSDVLVILETTALDPDAREFKYYAPGEGLIRVEEGLSEDLTDPEIVFKL